jgi:translation initiation factor IF-2
VQKALQGMLEPEIKEVQIGRAEVLATFRISKVGQVAGCRVQQGEIRRNARCRVWRGEEKIHEGELASLKHEKDDVREVRTGFECGIAFKGFNDFQVGDIIECFVMERVGG